MITRTKIKELEKKYIHVSGKGEKLVIVQKVNREGKLIGEDGNLLSSQEVKRIKAEHKKMDELGHLVIIRVSNED